jgi:two-component system response regulator PilR (NtrC family)
VIDNVIPPLRERREDLPALCEALLARIADESGLPTPVLTPSLLLQLAQLPLPGNVRELENLLHRALALSDGQTLQLDATDATGLVATAPADDALPNDLQSHLDGQEREILLQTLKETGFNRTAAAARLGLSLRQIRYRMARLHIDAPSVAEDPDATA